MLYKGKGPLHAAVMEKFTSVVEVLLRYHADVEMEVCCSCTVGEVEVGVTTKLRILRSE